MTDRPTHGPLPEGSPELSPAVDVILDPAHHREVLAAHAERMVVGGTDRKRRRVVVKVDRHAERHQREASVLRALRAAGIPVPEVLDARRSDEVVDAWVLVLEQVPGRPLEESDDDACWSGVGEGLARLHHALPAADAPPFVGQTDGTFADHIRAWTALGQRLGVDDGWLTSDQADRLGGLAGTAADHGAAAPEVLLHGDCAPEHWLRCPPALSRPVDLGDAGAGDPAYDLMVLTLTAPARLVAVLEGYGADADLRQHIEAVLPGYRALRLAGEVAWLREHGYDPTPSRTRLADVLA